MEKEPTRSMNSTATKITVISYCHEAHKKWIPFWAEQINKQEFRDFNVLFVFHNWGGAWFDYAEVGKIWRENVDDDLQSAGRFQMRRHDGPPVIGDVIDYAASQVKTEFLAHHDLDDVIHPKRLALQSAFLDANPDIDFLGTRMVGFTGEPKPEMLELNYVQPNEPNLHARTNEEIWRCFDRGQNCLGHTTMIYRPEALKALGGFSRSDVKLDGKSPDFETWKKAIMAGYKFYRLPELCALWRLDSSSIRL